MDRVQIEDVEPADDRTIQEDRADPLQGTDLPEEPDDAGGPVRPVDADPADPDRLQLLGKRDDHRRDRGVAVPAGEGSVVDGGHARVGFPERAP
jgi:hypothetical protein